MVEPQSTHPEVDAPFRARRRGQLIPRSPGAHAEWLSFQLSISARRNAVVAPRLPPASRDRVPPRSSPEPNPRKAAMATANALIRGSNLPRTAAVLRRTRPRATPISWWRSWLRLRSPALECDHCARSMTDFYALGAERICIRCVAEMRAPLATPELAGAAAVLRTLFAEAELEWQVQSSRPFVDKRRSDAILATAEIVLWWLTPPNLRRPDTVAIGECTALEVVAHFDRTWTLRSATKLSLGQVFTTWRDRQVKVQRHAELDDVDKRYATLIASERS